MGEEKRGIEQKLKYQSSVDQLTIADLHTIHLHIIPEQFTVKAHPLYLGGVGRGKKLRNTLIPYEKIFIIRLLSANSY